MQQFHFICPLWWFYFVHAFYTNQEAMRFDEWNVAIFHRKSSNNFRQNQVTENVSFLNRTNSYRHLWVTVMLVTSLCWWLYDGDWFEMLVAESLCWRLFSLCWDLINVKIGHQHPESVTNISNLSPTHLVSNIRHQHRCNPIFVGRT